MTGVPLAVVALLLVWLGGWPFAFLVMLASVCCAREYCHLCEVKGFQPQRFFTIAAAVLFTGGAQYLGYEPLSQLFLCMLMAVCLAFVLTRKPSVSAVVDSALTTLAMVYCAWLPAHLVLLRNVTRPDWEGQSFGLAVVALLVIVCLASDVGAYAFGKTLGVHKLSPRISPGKTCEGSLGGLFLAIVLAVVLGQHMGLPWHHCAILGALGSIMAQLGDLWESLLKRDVGLKDSGSLIRGHGGALDRFDSYLLASPFFYLYVTWFM